MVRPRRFKQTASGYRDLRADESVLLRTLPQRYPLLDGRHSKEAFRLAWEQDDTPVLRPLYLANDAMFRAASQFYRARRGKGLKALDPSSFFKRKGLHVQFARFWTGSGNSHRGRYRRAWGRFDRALKKVVEERN